MNKLSRLPKPNEVWYRSCGNYKMKVLAVDDQIVTLIETNLYSGQNYGPGKIPWNRLYEAGYITPPPRKLKVKLP